MNGGKLEIKEVTTAYDKADVLQGVSLTIELTVACGKVTAPPDAFVHRRYIRLQ